MLWLPTSLVGNTLPRSQSVIEQVLNRFAIVRFLHLSCANKALPKLDRKESRRTLLPAHLGIYRVVCALTWEDT